MIFVSTSCLKGETGTFNPDVYRVLDIYKKLGIENIELGASHQPLHNEKELLKKCKEVGKKFICHGNFPPTGDKRMLNICSEEKSMKKLVLSSAKSSIEFVSKLNGNIHSMHFGCTKEIDANIQFLSKEISQKKAIENGINILGIICDYAKDFNIKIALENAPPHHFCVNVNPETTNEILKRISAKNLGLLTDLGHARLTQQKLNIDWSEFTKLQNKILEFHVHDVVNGKDHQHFQSKEVFEGFDKDILKNTSLTLESNNVSEEQILSSIDVLSKVF